MGINWSRIRQRKAFADLVDMLEEDYPEILVDFILRYGEKYPNFMEDLQKGKHK